MLFPLLHPGGNAVSGITVDPFLGGYRLFTVVTITLGKTAPEKNF